MIRGIEGELPPITGYVMTTKKENPLVEVSLVAPQPGSEKNRTILASWTYGLGRAVAFTTDAGFRYAANWTGWENYDKLFGQMIVWSMRPAGDEGQFTVSTEVDEGQVQVVVNALDRKDEFYNFLNMAGTVVGPNLEPVELKLKQTAPGRYQGSFPGRDAGSYFVMISPAPGMAPLRSGVNVPYSDEFRSRAANEALLGQLASLEPKGGGPGRLLQPIDELGQIEPLLAVDTFRHNLAKATRSQDIWHLVALLSGCLLFFDVFVRRVQVSFAWAPALASRVAARLFGHTVEVPQAATIERLRSRKAEVDDRVRQLQASARFEAPDDDRAGPPPELAQQLGQTEPLEQKAAPSLSEQPPAEDESYTARLLRAKKKAWKKEG